MMRCSGFGSNQHLMADATVKTLEIKKCGELLNGTGMEPPMSMALTLRLGQFWIAFECLSDWGGGSASAKES